MKLSAIIGLLLLAAATAAGWGHHKHRREVQELRARLLDSKVMEAAENPGIDDASPPPPVARYLRLALGTHRARDGAVEIQDDLSRRGTGNWRRERDSNCPANY